MQRSLFNLAPRGFGRASFRLTELIQMGLIPVYLWDDVEWLPYAGSSASLQEIGYSVNIETFPEWLTSMVQQVKNEPDKLAETLLQKRSKMLQLVDTHYNFRGAMYQLELFFQGEGKSDLACIPQPNRAALW
jgi:hypothetical protein